MTAILDKMELNDLPSSLQKVAEVIGINATKELIVKLSGETVYFPKTLNSSYHKKYISSDI